jgi:radical SAM protein with 4Fe4S-binding SPASM domain
MTPIVLKPSRFITAEPLCGTGQVALFHALHRTVGRLPLAAWEAAQAGTLNDEATAQHMAGLGLLVMPSAREDLALAHQERLSAYDMTRLTYIVSPSANCGLVCQACSPAREKGWRRMSPSTARQVLAYLVNDIERKRPTEVHLDFIGLDASLHPETMRFLAEGLNAFCRGRRLTYRVSLVHSGMNLKASVIESLKPFGLDHVRVVIGGAPGVHEPDRPTQDETPGYERFMNQLTAAAGLCDLRLVVYYDPAQGEHLRLPALLNDLLARGLREYLTQVRFVPILPAPGENKKTVSLCRAECLLDPDPERHLWLRHQAVTRGFSAPPLISGFECPAGRRGTQVIDVRGRLALCPFAPDPPGLDAGDVRLGADFQTEAIKLTRELPEECRLRCPVAPLCLGGCRLLAAPPNGTQCLRQTLEQSIRAYLRQLADPSAGASSGVVAL